MGWLWNSSSSADDAVDQLDPELRKYLHKETPKSTYSELPRRENQSYTEQLHLDESSSESINANKSQPTSQDPDAPKVPPQSLYQDGRYAHIWKNYRPQHVIDGAVKTDAVKLRDMFETYEDKKRESGRAALENCVFQQLAYSDCLKGGDWYARSTLCTTEQRALNRCIDMQAKFLRALGYLSVPGRSAEDEERIQMHADKLYQRMLEQERIRIEAKEKGEPIPQFPPVVPTAGLTAALGGPVTDTSRDDPKPLYRPTRGDPIDLSDFPTEKARNYFRKLLKENPKWTHEEMEVEKADTLARYKEDSDLAKTYNDILEERKQLAERRFAEGRPTVSDRLQRLRKYLF